ncbi:hypothetical protein [Streptomyces sp. WMMB 322]|uniref:hypothetical protein n=1 Tax=Streptomyces sp. WMMB 322 TaxID=1286821 RepID=UPI0006E26B93|nr:hypothetical protein [Streptomyces sp. WMMB 322]SCK22236.1 hypothetical protein H180DRAFT_01631 [Streptomyces sp. WMMB 322]
MESEGLSRAVRRQLGLGRLLPLGDAQDGAWLAESAAVASLRATASAALPHVRIGDLRISSAGPGTAGLPAVPPPPSALPPGPLRIDAAFASPAHVPLTTTAQLLRATLLTAADRTLGLRVRTVDLRVTDLLESTNGHDGRSPGDGYRAGVSGAAGHPARPAERASAPETHPPAPADDPDGAATAQAVISVPGVTRLDPVLGPASGGRAAGAVSVTDTTDAAGRPTGRHLQIQIAVAEASRALDVARDVRHAAGKAAAWDAEEPSLPVTVAVLIGAVDPERHG